MGGVCGTQEARTDTTLEIEQGIKDDLKEKKFTLRVLILGTTACGKSTVAKQMKIIHGNGFTDEEKANFKMVLVLNLFHGIKELLTQAEKFNYKILRKNKKTAKFFTDSNPYSCDLGPEIAIKAKQLWQDKGIEKTFKKRNLFDMPPNIKYIIDNIDRFADETWTPTNEDILRARQRTTGIVETRFKKDRYNWVLIDVGGQRTERRKWMHSFDGANAAIYVAALDEFDMANPENPTMTRMEESLQVFGSTLNMPAFDSVCIILFLNKTDLFAEKIKVIDVTKTFPDWEAGSNYEDGVKYILDLYKSKLSERRNPDSIYVHETCAIDTNQIQFVFKAVMDTIFRERLRISGL